MKKLFMVIAACTLTTIAYSQTEKGALITSLTGSGHFSYKSSFYQDYALRANVLGLKMVANNLGIGLALETEYNKFQYYSPGPTGVPGRSDLTLEPAAVVRKYFGKSRLKPYAELDLGWRFNTYRYFDAEGVRNYRDNENEPFIRPTAGLSYWLNDRISVDVNAGYNMDLIDAFGFRNWQLNLGFSCKIGK